MGVVVGWRMMNRRAWFKRAALVAAGGIAGDQLEILEKLAHSKVFALGAMPVENTYVTALEAAALPMGNYNEMFFAREALATIERQLGLAVRVHRGQRIGYYKTWSESDEQT